MKKYFLVLFILLVTLINFNVFRNDIIQSMSSYSNSSEVFEQTNEEDFAVSEIDQNLPIPLVISVIPSECKVPQKIASIIWKPPVNS